MHGSSCSVLLCWAAALPVDVAYVQALLMCRRCFVVCLFGVATQRPFSQGPTLRKVKNDEALLFDRW